MLAGVVGGVIAPLVRRGEPRDFSSPGLGGWIWPTIVCLPAAVVPPFVRLPETVLEAVYGDEQVPYLFDVSPGEWKEFCLALFLMVYLLSLYRALRSLA